MQAIGWHHADIKAALEKKGYTQKMIADEFGLTKGSVHVILVYRQNSHSAETIHKVQMRVAQIVGVPAEELWPDRYKKEDS